MVRRLAAVIAADVVEYSKMMSEDEVGTINALSHLRRNTLEPAIESFSGHIAKNMGDGWLITFVNTADAIHCATYLLGKLCDGKIRLRIGIHVGDITYEDEDVFGVGINVAARLEALAEPSELLISDNAYSMLDGQSAAQFVDMGFEKLKNISQPIRIWKWQGLKPVHDPVLTVAAPDSLLLLKKPSVVVMPFANMSNDSSQEYFSDGISEDIITALSKVHWLFVTGRHSSFSYKHKALDPVRVACELGVRYVVEGSVRKDGSKVRITVQLVDGLTGSRVWAERYDRNLENIFALQDEITDTVVGRVDSELRSNEIERVRRKPPDSLDAWELYQRGLWHLYKRGAEDNDRAREFFRDAIAHDPDFALPYAGLAEACYSEIFHGFCDDPKSRLKEGLEAGERAASLDDREGATHYGLGRMLVIANESERAIACLEKSVDRNPSFAHGYFGLGAALCWFGRPAEGIEHLDLAMRLSPCDPLLWAMQSYRATCCNSLEQFELAEEWSKRSRNLRYNNIYAHINLIVALEGQGRVNETLEAVKSLLNLRHDFRVSELRELWKNFNVRDLKCYQKALCRAGLPE